MEPFKYPMIIDTDIGDDIDDTWSVMYMIASKRFDVRGIVVTNYDTEYKAALMAKMLEKLNRIDIPIYVAPPTDLPKKYKRGQERYVSDFSLADYRGKVIKENAIQKLAKDISIIDGRVAVFELATNTSLAALLSFENIEDKIFVYAMAGAVDGSYEGFDNVVAEFNVAIDKAASEKVFKSKAVYTMLPLDVCNNIRINGALFQRFLKCDTEPANIIKTNYQDWIVNGYFENDNVYSLSSSRLFDLIVPFYALWPQNFTEQKSNITVNSEGITYRGGNKQITWTSKVKNIQDMLQDVVSVFENYK